MNYVPNLRGTADVFFIFNYCIRLVFFLGTYKVLMQSYEYNLLFLTF